MVRAFKFDVDPVVEVLDRILQMELAGVIYYTHYSFMVYGHARIPITSWLRENATESLTHAQEAGEMIMRLHKRPTLGVGALPITKHNTIDQIVTEAVEREEAGIELYRDRVETEWPRTVDGRLAMDTRPLDLRALLREVA